MGLFQISEQDITEGVREKALGQEIDRQSLDFVVPARSRRRSDEQKVQSAASNYDR